MWIRAQLGRTNKWILGILGHSSSKEKLLNSQKRICMVYILHLAFSSTNSWKNWCLSSSLWTGGLASRRNIFSAWNTEQSNVHPDTAQGQLVPTPKGQLWNFQEFCELVDIKLVAWNRPSWDYIHHRHWQGHFYSTPRKGNIEGTLPTSLFPSRETFQSLNWAWVSLDLCTSPHSRSATPGSSCPVCARLIRVDTGLRLYSSGCHCTCFLPGGILGSPQWPHI